MENNTQEEFVVVSKKTIDNISAVLEMAYSAAKGVISGIQSKEQLPTQMVYKCVCHIDAKTMRLLELLNGMQDNRIKDPLKYIKE
jgi:hypothetical protein